jgi:uncharacterized protein YabE (DUF348 family)
MIEVVSFTRGQLVTKAFTLKRVSLFMAVLAATVIGSTYFIHTYAQAQSEDRRLITVYDRSTKSSFLTDKSTIGEALEQNGVELDQHDTVEPSRNEELVANDYQVNIYRARPVFVTDGKTRVKVMSAFQTSPQIAKDAGISLYPEDIASLKPTTDFVGDGAGLQMSVVRAVPIILDLYANKSEVRTQGKTVGAMLQEKGIKLSASTRVSLSLSTPITAGLEVRVWQEGVQTVSITSEVAFPVQQIYDADREVGYKTISTKGVVGAKNTTYEIEVKDGVEISRKEIASIVTIQPVKQVEAIGIKPGPNALTKSKGAQMWKDSRGIVHRETYYDLNMSKVMNACGNGGVYTVRFDGVKVDAQGYVIIAAKVYDTGGFAARHPDGFDLATDWTNYDGR